MHRLTIAATVLFGVLVGCYQDDALHPAAIAPTKVYLTDAPFPFDTVGSVNIYVSRIEAGLDTTTWDTLAIPNKTFDLLRLERGKTAFLGQQAIDAGHYQWIRMTIDVSKSSIKYVDSTNAVVHWPSTGTGEIQLYARVEEPLAVSALGADIVIDFDVGRSFQFDLYGGNDFTMQAKLRAVNSAATGTIIGSVVRALDGGFAPVENADVTVYDGDPTRSQATWDVVATGHSYNAGDFHVSFLTAGTYIVRVEQPKLPWLAAVTIPNVQVTAGGTDSIGVVLQLAGAGVRITGPDTVGYGGVISLAASVADSNGNPEQYPQISWLSRDTSIALVLQDSSSSADSVARAVVLGRGVGRAWIVATSGALQDSVSIEVVDVIAPLNNPVASITLIPASRTVAVNDSGSFVAELRDSVGNLLTNRQISWFLTDSSGVADLVWASGVNALVYGRHSGTTHLRVASESKFKDATITVP